MTLQPHQDSLPDEEAMVKARLVLDALRAAALAPEFAFNQEQAEPMWAAAVAGFTTNVLTKAVGMWAMGHSAFPSLAEFLTIARYADSEAHRAEVADEAQRSAATPRLCPECSDGYSNVHFVIVKEDDGSHAAVPCSRCLPERYELYVRGHFRQLHVDRGGCPLCWDYHPSLRHRVKATSR